APPDASTPYVLVPLRLHERCNRFIVNRQADGSFLHATAAEFSQALSSQRMDSQRILALDVGDRRIGLAITDPLGLTAQPLFTLHRTTLRADLKAIARFIRQHQVEALLVGNPLHA